jgi:photosystem II PsbJ protein
LVFYSPVISLTNWSYFKEQLGGKIMFAEGRIPLWLVATIAGLGVIAVVGLFFYGAYAGLGSSM